MNDTNDTPEKTTCGMTREEVELLSFLASAHRVALLLRKLRARNEGAKITPESFCVVDAEIELTDGAIARLLDMLVGMGRP